jgi:hypothetical protein
MVLWVSVGIILERVYLSYFAEGNAPIIVSANLRNLDLTSPSLPTREWYFSGPGPQRDAQEVQLLNIWEHECTADYAYWCFPEDKKHDIIQ